MLLPACHDHHLLKVSMTVSKHELLILFTSEEINCLFFIVSSQISPSVSRLVKAKAMWIVMTASSKRLIGWIQTYRLVCFPWGKQQHNMFHRGERAAATICAAATYTRGTHMYACSGIWHVDPAGKAGASIWWVVHAVLGGACCQHVHCPTFFLCGVFDTRVSQDLPVSSPPPPVLQICGTAHRICMLIWTRPLTSTGLRYK